MEKNLQNGPQKKIDSNSPEGKLQKISRTAGSSIHRHMERMWDDLIINAKANNLTKTLFIKKMKDNLTKLVPEATGKEVFLDVDQVVNSSKNKELLMEKATEITMKILSKYLSLEELERRLREKHLAVPGIKELSRALSCSISEDSNMAELHVPVTFFEDSKSVIDSFKEGLAVLATKIKQEEEFKSIRVIRGYSSLVKDNFRLMGELGFKVTYNEMGRPTEEALMSREKLLEIYGN